MAAGAGAGEDRGGGFLAGRGCRHLAAGASPAPWRPAPAAPTKPRPAASPNRTRWPGHPPPRPMPDRRPPGASAPLRRHAAGPGRGAERRTAEPHPTAPAPATRHRGPAQPNLRSHRRRGRGRAVQRREDFLACGTNRNGRARRPDRRHGSIPGSVASRTEMVFCRETTGSRKRVMSAGRAETAARLSFR